MSTFPTDEGAVYLSVKPSKDLYSFHREFHDLAIAYSDSLSAYYLPDNWVPHCTLDMNLQEKEVSKVIELCRGSELPSHGTLSEIGLISFRPVVELMNYSIND